MELRSKPPDLYHALVHSFTKVFSTYLGGIEVKHLYREGQDIYIKAGESDIPHLHKSSQLWKIYTLKSTTPKALSAVGVGSAFG